MEQYQHYRRLREEDVDRAKQLLEANAPVATIARLISLSRNFRVIPKQISNLKQVSKLKPLQKIHNIFPILRVCEFPKAFY